MKFVKKSDILSLFFLLAIASAAFFLWRAGAEGIPARAEIYLGSELKAEIDLTSPIPRRFSIAERPEVVFEVFSDGSIAFVQSDCPNKICIRSGRLKIPGTVAACIPNLLFLKIAPAAGFGGVDYPDAVSG